MTAPAYTDAEYARLAAAQEAKSELRQTEAAFEELRQGFMGALIATEASNAADREQCYLAIKILDRVKAALIAKTTDAAIVEHTASIRSILAGDDAG